MQLFVLLPWKQIVRGMQNRRGNVEDALFFQQAILTARPMILIDGEIVI